MFGINTIEKARIDSSGRLLVGTSTARTNFNSGAPTFQVEGVSTSASQASVINNTPNGNWPRLNLAKTRNNGTVSGMTPVIAEDGLGSIDFSGADGTNFIRGATITAYVDGTPGANDMPGRLVFSTTADGASSPTERMRIKSSGIINFSNAPVYADNTAAKAGGLVAGDIYRKADGTLMITF